MSGWTVLVSSIPLKHVSNTRACRYFRKTELLVIEFESGAMYAYEDVPWDVYMGFRRAESHGSYFARYIRDQYNYQQIDSESAKSIGLR